MYSWSSVGLLYLIVGITGHQCPPWYYFRNSSQECECPYFVPWGIRCYQQDRTIKVADGYCVSFYDNTYCAGNCVYAHQGNYTDRLFSQVPSDPDKLDETMCGYYNRQGLLCGRCRDNFGPAVFSLEVKCSDCSHLSTPIAIILYLMLEFIPIAIFFMIVLFTRLNITRGPLFGYVFFCQAYMFGIKTNIYVVSHILSHSSPLLRGVIYISMALSNVWLLKFASSVITSFCISSHFTNIHLQLLAIIRPISPIIILIAVFILIELYKRDFQIVVFAWRHLGRVIQRISLKPVNGNAIIHAFASFLFLTSYVLNFATISITTWNPVFKMDWSIEKYVVFEDPTIVFFSGDYLLTVGILFAFFIPIVVIPSVFLFLYPTRLYRYISRFISNRKQLALKMFAEALHACFKDGLNGTLDYRSMAGLSMIVGLLFQMLSYATYRLMYIFQYSSPYSIPMYSGFILFVISLSISFVRPCKSLIANLSLSYHVMVLGILHMALTLWRKDLYTNTTTLEAVFIGTPLISHILVLCWAGKSIVKWVYARFNKTSIKH